jgi:hypothetical protein
MVESLDRRVRERAGNRCEYCPAPADVSAFPFPPDHIIAQQHGGETMYENLAQSCPHDNFHTQEPEHRRARPADSPADPALQPAPPAMDIHFAWDGPLLVSKTAVGRTTIRVLNRNHSDRVELRRLLIAAGSFPP